MRSLLDARLHFAELSSPQPADGEKITGTSGADDLYGTDGDDTISGLGGNDYLVGGAGDDSLLGGAGQDNLNDDGGGSDRLFGGSGDDQLHVFRSFIPSPDKPDHVLLDGGDGNDWLSVDTSNGDGIDYAIEATLLGGVGDDILVADTAQHANLDGGDGADTIESTFGEDRVVTLGAGQDVIAFDWQQGTTAMTVTDFAAGDSGDTIQMRNLFAGMLQGWDQENPFGEGYLRLVQHGADVVLQYDADGGGDSWSDFIVFQNTQKSAFTAFNLDGYPPDGSEPAGQLFTGTGANDGLSGTIGTDTLLGLGGDDNLYGDASDDSLSGGAGNDYLDGGYGSDTLDGGDGNDYLGDGAGADLMLGGAGDDTIGHSFGSVGGTATLNGGKGDDQLSINFFSNNVSGRAIVLGGTGDDSFVVEGAGKATLNGGAGDDHFELATPDHRIVITLGEGHDTVAFDDAQAGDTAAVITDFAAGASGDTIDLYAFLKTHLTGWDYSANPFGEGYVRVVAQGADTLLQWSAAADGNWNDLVLLKGVAPGELTQENLGGYPSDGSEPIGTLVTGTLADDNLTGDIGPDTINGAKGFDHLYGGAGDDSLLGGGGNDTLYGGYGADVMNGGTGDDLLDGSDGGADTLIGGDGDDDLAMHRFGTTPPAAVGVIVMQGGAGDDYIVYGADQLNQDHVSIDGGTGDDWIRFEQAVAAATVSGGDGNDTITGGYGLQTIDGGAGDDQITVSVGPANTVTLGAGSDVLNLNGGFTYFYSGAPAEVTDFTPKDRLGLHTLVLQNYSDSVTDPFNDGHLRLAQVGADTVLQGATQNGEWVSLLKLDGINAAQLTADQLDGYAPGPVWLIGTDGDDTLSAKKGFSHLDAGHGDDVLTGSSQADVLIGGQGADTLTGRGGGDAFVYNSVQDSTADARDLITDLANVDVIDLSRIDADTSDFGDQAFHVVASFSGQAGELTLTYDKASGQTLLAGDVNGDGTADLEIAIRGDHHDFSHFVL